MRAEHRKSVVVREWLSLTAALIVLRNAGTENENSDIDLLLEFSAPISLLTLSSIQCELEEALGVPVDVIQGPIAKEDMVEIKNEVILYSA